MTRGLVTQLSLIGPESGKPWRLDASESVSILAIKATMVKKVIAKKFATKSHHRLWIQESYQKRFTTRWCSRRFHSRPETRNRPAAFFRRRRKRRRRHRRERCCGRRIGGTSRDSNPGRPGKDASARASSRSRRCRLLARSCCLGSIRPKSQILLLARRESR